MKGEAPHSKLYDFSATPYYLSQKPIPVKMNKVRGIIRQPDFSFPCDFRSKPGKCLPVGKRRYIDKYQIRIK